MVFDICESQVLRAALGRNAFIGELYDIRSESFSSRSLLKSSLPSSFIQKLNINRTELQYKVIENASDRFDLLGVEAELQVSILCGLITVDGSGKYLTDEKKSQKTVSMSLICKFQTICEKICSSFEEIIQYVDLTALQDPSYTHVIFEVNWGANCLLTLEAVQSSQMSRKELEGSLKGSLLKVGSLVDAKGGGDIEKKDFSEIEFNNVDVRVSADVIPIEGLPTTIETFKNFLLKIPTLLKEVNDGKGKPLNYIMIPLSSIKRVARLENAVETLVKSVDESFLLSVVWFFEEISILKQRLLDLLEEMKKYQKYIKKEDLKVAREQNENLKLRESELKLLINGDLLSVRSGKGSLKELMKNVEKFKNQKLRLHIYEDYLDSCSSIQNRMKTVKNFISTGCHYLGRGEKLSDLYGQFLSHEFIVLIISSEMEKEDPELYQKTCSYFLTLVNYHKPKTKYVVFDLDVEGVVKKQISSVKSTASCISVKDGNILSFDLYGDYLVDRQSNFVRLRPGIEVECVSHKPGGRVSMEMTCPAFGTGICSPDKLKWICFNCKSAVEYDFKSYFYCLCGRGPSNGYEFRCGHITHGITFVSPKTEFLKDQLSVLRPFKELNILILGQSGVGKTTWINSIINYLSYNSLKTAEENGVICEIPTSFTMYSKGMKKYVINVGNSRDDEVTSTGESATQTCRTYNFVWEDRYVRLIDTPGLADTRGIHQDKVNMQNVIEHLGLFKELHGICILFKANDNRINAVFSYCLNELLVHLHRSATNNIVFCFTNARSSFYSPGQTSSLLEKELDRLGLSNELILGEHNMFCLDNEAFLFLCSLNYSDICHDNDLVESFDKSWTISKKETQRLFKTIKNFKPHLLKNTLSLVTARNRILSLTKPIAEITKTIQLNLTAIEKNKNYIKTSNETIEELAKNLKYSVIDLESKPLSKPRTVCTSPSCVVYHKYKTVDISGIEYKTHCHSECYLNNVVPKTTSNELLKRCNAMGSNGICQVCGCGWYKHMHITFSQKMVERECINKTVECNLQKEQSAKEKIEKFVQDLEYKTRKYEKEQEIILQTSVKLGMFLKENAIAVYNDSFASYLEYLINEEENKPYKSESEKKLLKSMMEMLNHYKAEVSVLQDVIKKSGTEYKQLTVPEVFELEQKLYDLELCGEDIRKSVEMNRKSAVKVLHLMEVSLPIKSREKLKNKIETFPVSIWNWLGLENTKK